MAQKPLPDPEASSASPAFQTTTKTISSDRRVHMSLQHKGGVGKSFVANCIAQFFASAKAAGESHRRRSRATNPWQHIKP